VGQAMLLRGSFQEAQVYYKRALESARHPLGEAQATLGTVALSLVISGFVFWTFGRKMGRVAGITNRLREVGRPGTATVVAIGDTGITVNNDPVVAFTLDVTVDDAPSYRVEIRQLMSRLMMGAVMPDAQLSVLVDPSAPDRVAIDWSATPEEAPQAGAQKFNVSSAADTLRLGRPGTAVITSMKDLGDISDLGVVPEGAPGDDDRVFLIEMSVKLSGRSPYDATVGHRVPLHLAGKVGPRTEVVVGVDRDDDQGVAIDWEKLGG